MTKTETIRKGLIKLGYSSRDHISHRECFHSLRLCKDGKHRDHYVWLLTGTLRGGFDSRIGQAIALPALTQRAFEAGRA